MQPAPVNPDNGTRNGSGHASSRAITREMMLRRLCEVVSMPLTRISRHERDMAGDILIELLKLGSAAMRQQTAQRLAALADSPKRVTLLLARDDVSVARPLLEESTALNDSDLIHITQTASSAHRRIIAARKNLGEAVVDMLAIHGDVQTLSVLLLNTTASISITTMDRLVRASRDHATLVAPLLRRQELTPAHAFAVFWWADEDGRRAILKRFAVDRAVLIASASDMFPIAAEDNFADAVVRKALQYIERRQRNRAAMARSPYGTLEAAIDAALAKPDLFVINEIAYICGIKPVTAAQIFGDAGGEAVAILCKAVGLKRDYVERLWRALRRPVSPDPASPFQRMAFAYDSLAVAKAQTVLRYWNWALSSDFNRNDLGKAEELDEDASVARQAAALVLGRPK